MTHKEIPMKCEDTNNASQIITFYISPTCMKRHFKNYLVRKSYVKTQKITGLMHALEAELVHMSLVFLICCELTQHSLT